MNKTYLHFDAFQVNVIMCLSEIHHIPTNKAKLVSCHLLTINNGE